MTSDTSSDSSKLNRVINIVFLEDEPDLSIIIRMTLEYMQNIEAIVIPNAEEALEYFEKNHEEIDVIVSDHYLPGMTGIEFLEIIKEKYPKIVRYVVTGSIQNEVFIEAKEKAEPQHIFEKPLIIEDIIYEIVKLFLSRQ